MRNHAREMLACDFFGATQPDRTSRSHVDVRPTSDCLFVMDERGRIIAFPVDRTRGFDIAAPLTPILSGASYGAGYDRAADGTQFLLPVVSRGTSNAGRLLVVQNWRRR